MIPTHDEVLRFMNDLDAGSNLFGALSPEVRARLFAVVDKPTQQTWSDAHGIILNAQTMTTLWQAVLAHTDYDVTVGPSYMPGNGQTSGWPSIPTSDQLLLAIRAAVV